MDTDHTAPQPPRELETLLRAHLDNTMACGQTLQRLFADITGFDAYVIQVKQREEQGDRLTAEAYQALEQLPPSEFAHLAEQLIKRLDDIVDGINDTARIVDVCAPRKTMPAAHELVNSLLAMIARLQQELAQYPGNDLASAKACRETLKGWEEKADQLYHEWRKTERRLSALPLVDESNWTEILGTLEQTTDAAYHAALLLERMTKYRWRETGR
jgi:hypothetical protein